MEAATGRLETQMGNLKTSTTEQNVSFMAQVTAIRSVDMGLRGLVNVGSELGLISGKLEKGFRAVSVAVHGVSSAFQLLKGARMIITQLRNAEVGLATVEAFRAGLKGKMGMVVLGIGAAAAAGGYLAGRSSVSNSTTNNTSVTFNPYANQTDQRAVSRDTLDAMGGY
mgnify:CR=1 FL=1